MATHDIYSTGVYNYDDYTTPPPAVTINIHDMSGIRVYVELAGQVQCRCINLPCTKHNYLWTDEFGDSDLQSIPMDGSCQIFPMTNVIIADMLIPSAVFDIRLVMKRYDSCDMASCGGWTQHFVSKITVGDIPSGTPPHCRFTSGLSHRSVH